MVLVDTSVWIHFLADRAPYAAELSRLLSVEQVTGHELVYGELLVGDRGGRRKLLDAYQKVPQARTVPHDDVVVFVRDRHLHGRGVGWIDVHILAAALVDRLRLWTADPRLAAMAREFGVEHRSDALNDGPGNSEPPA